MILQSWIAFIIAALCIASVHAEAGKNCGPVPLGSTFDENCKLKPVLPPGDALASDHQVFFDLHQAIGFLEANKAGRCLSGLAKADQHIAVLTAAKNHVRQKELLSMIERINTLRKKLETENISDLEAFRERLHQLANTHHWQHESAWHQEFQKCQL